MHNWRIKVFIHLPALSALDAITRNVPKSSTNNLCVQTGSDSSNLTTNKNMTFLCTLFRLCTDVSKKKLRNEPKRPLNGTQENDILCRGTSLFFLNGSYFAYSSNPYKYFIKVDF